MQKSLEAAQEVGRSLKGQLQEAKRDGQALQVRRRLLAPAHACGSVVNPQAALEGEERLRRACACHL